MVAAEDDCVSTGVTEGKLAAILLIGEAMGGDVAAVAATGELEGWKS